MHAPMLTMLVKLRKSRNSMKNPAEISESKPSMKPKELIDTQIEHGKHELVTNLMCFVLEVVARLVALHHTTTVQMERRNRVSVCYRAAHASSSLSSDLTIQKGADEKRRR
ncbi:hypothetical protein GUJ93_ZPchr0003g16952 [Zizania palustris]|uniref:Uncharacterized protein n=1 Tax=Zizania palustris TaxID=103762 RepID=A0A8J5S8S1_ZIZPA|nr:hypothetical protein GUJ93_ZPchr0003g16952 [Zizania palustris]